MASNRQMIVAALRAAKSELSRGTNTDWGLAHYICWAIGDGVFAQGLSTKSEQLAVAVIQERLGAHAYVDQWLVHNVLGARVFFGNLPDTAERRRVIQEYRHRWLDALIGEFSN